VQYSEYTTPPAWFYFKATGWDATAALPVVAG